MTILQGLNRPDQAVEAWERAVAALPTENLTAAQQKQSDQYKAELAAAQAKLEDLKARPREPEGAIRMQDGDQLPWNRAAALLPELERTGVWDSSVSWLLELPSEPILILAIRYRLGWSCTRIK